MRLRWRLRKRAVIVGLAVAALLAGLIALAAVLRQPTPVGVRTLRIPVVDGPRDNQRVVLDATFFTPEGQDRVPAILLAPGFGETKDAVQPQAEYLARARCQHRADRAELAGLRDQGHRATGELAGPAAKGPAQPSR